MSNTIPQPIKLPTFLSIEFRRLLESFEALNHQSGLIQKGDRLVVGVSGGPDSTALLTLLGKLQKKYQLSIFSAHLNHKLSRQAASFEKAAQVVSNDLKIPFNSRKINVTQEARKHRRSLEAQGRFERYQFFRELARKYRCQKIVTAHTLDDQAETMLMRILRGSGLRGLLSIYPKRSEGRYEVIRPLLASTKSEIYAFLKKSKLHYVEDKSNRTKSFLRNRVRHDLLPMLEKWNPNIRRRLADQQSILQDIQSYLDSQSQRLKDRKKPFSVSVKTLASAPKALAREVIVDMIGRAYPEGEWATYTHVEAVMRMIASPEGRMEQSLPGGIRILKVAGRIQVDSPGHLRL